MGSKEHFFQKFLSFFPTYRQVSVYALEKMRYKTALPERIWQGCFMCSRRAHALRGESS